MSLVVILAAVPLLAVRQASAPLRSRPTLTLIHLDHVDHAGHENGWLSVEYLEAVREADRLLQHVVQALRERRLWDRTAIIVTLDLGPTAIVTRSDVLYGMARMYSILAEGVGAAAQVFHDVESATRWLDGLRANIE